MTNDMIDIPDFLRRTEGDHAEYKETPAQKLTALKMAEESQSSLNAKPFPPAKQMSPKLIGFKVRDMLEDMIDNNEIDKAFHLLNKVKSKSGVITYLQNLFTEAKWEMENARGEELSEYFVGVTDEEIETRLKGYVRFLTDIESITQNKRAKRKTKVRGAVAKAVSNVNYRVSDPELKVSSIDPSTVIGVKGLLTFNVKSRRISYFVTADESGLQISGTTIKNFDEDKSIAKTLRKPEDQLQHFRKAPGIRRVNVLLKDTIRGKVFKVGGRINKDTLLLKVFK